MFRSALLALKPSTSQRYVIESATRLAQAQPLELTACTVVDARREAPAEPVPLGASAFKQHHDQQLLTAARQAAEESVAAFRTACRQHAVRHQAAVVEGPTVDRISEQANTHDLLLVGHSLGDDTGDESVLHAILKHSSRPAIVFPKISARDGDVVVAYDGSLQAARTLASFAYSGIGAGRIVHVVSIHDDPSLASARTQQAGRFLQRHGIVPQSHVEPAASSVPEILLDKIVQYSAGMLVMGAFGEGAVREFLFGSVTRRILHALPIPVFVNH